jgi:hypothetical protein
MRDFLTFLLITFFSFLFLVAIVSSVFCCSETPGQPRKCWTYGACCKKGTPEEYWHPTGCFGLKSWVEPENMMFTVGKKTSVNLYLKNEGTYSDNYEVEYVITEGNPALIQVDMSGASSAENMDPGEVRVLHPRVTVILAQAQGEILFNVTSQADPNLYDNATLRVQGSDLPLSLQEFDTLVLFITIIITGIIYYFVARH